MFTILTYDTLHGSRADAPGSPMPEDVARRLREAVTAYAHAHGEVWEVHTLSFPGGGASYHLTLWANRPLDLVALAGIARDHGQDAIGVLQGSTLVGPGSADYPTTVKPRD